MPSEIQLASHRGMKCLNPRFIRVNPRLNLLHGYGLRSLNHHSPLTIHYLLERRLLIVLQLVIFVIVKIIIIVIIIIAVDIFNDLFHHFILRGLRVFDESIVEHLCHSLSKSASVARDW